MRKMKEMTTETKPCSYTPCANVHTFDLGHDVCRCGERALDGKPRVTSDLYLSDVELLCVTCKQPIRARINTPQWVKVEWISPQGECQSCNNLRKQIAVTTNEGD